MSDSKDQTVKFKYIIPDNLKDCYINGAWGGVTPRGEIHLHAYSERNCIPKTCVHNVTKDGKLGEQIDMNAGGDYVRVIQSSLIMNLSTAKSLRKWLDDMIQAAEKNQQ